MFDNTKHHMNKLIKSISKLRDMIHMLKHWTGQPQFDNRDMRILNFEQ